MASKRKRYSVQRRIEVWVETEILADDFDDAVTQAKELTATDFVTPVSGNFNDWSWLPGLGVNEQF